jgi:hypothetical protein
MIKRIVVIAVAAGALAVPAVSSADKGGNPNGHSPAWQCRHAQFNLTPHMQPAWANCVRARAHAQREANKPASKPPQNKPEDNEPGKPEDSD